MDLIRIILRHIVAAALLCASLGATAADPSADQTAIRHVLMSTFDKPEARLVVDPVVVVGAHAVAGWAQGERGGRALLSRQGTQWRITLCAGDGLKQASMLREAGLSAADADSLAKGLATAEAKLPAAQRAKFSTFDGVVRMDASGQHPPAHKQ
jgi:hypothetical protein